MSPPKREKPALAGRPSRDYTDASHCTACARQLRARRAASWRLPVLQSGLSDPWHYEPPTAGYEAAAAHLLAHGLTPAPNREALRLMWRAGGQSRRAAQVIAERWELAA